jgi:hypothetical protein
LARANVKVRSAVSPSEAIRSLGGVAGVTAVVRTFPDHPDPDLAALYVVDIRPENADEIVAQLRSLPEVEYAELTAPRTLIR